MKAAEYIELVGGPWDGQRVKFAGGLRIIVCNAVTQETSSYRYVAREVAGERVVDRAEYSGPGP